MQYIGVQAIYELLINSEIVISGVKVMTEGHWEEQTGDGLEDFGQWRYTATR